MSKGDLKMAATDIKLVRKKASAPDLGRNITLMYREKNFPLTDESGNVKYTTELDAQGAQIPEYYDFIINVQMPSPIPTTAPLRQAMLDALKLQADDQAKIIAQIRANDIVDKNKIRVIVKTLNDDTGTVFEGTAVIPT